MPHTYVCAAYLSNVYDVGLGKLIVAQEIISFLSAEYVPDLLIGGNVRGRVSARRLGTGTPRMQGPGLVQNSPVQTSEL